MPDGDVTPLREAASTLHEIYTELVAAGFTKRQAFDMTTSVLKSIVAEGLQGNVPEATPETTPGD